MFRSELKRTHNTNATHPVNKDKEKFPRVNRRTKDGVTYLVEYSSK